jgi:MoxR-like ATPase
MNATVTLTQSELPEFLLHVAVVRPVFIWGQPGIGKSALVEQFAESLGMDCVSLLGTQLAPEDISGVPQVTREGKSRFNPPEMIARDEPYVLFLDELNGSSHEVQKAFYSLIHDRRVGDFKLAQGSVVIGAGNRIQDSAIVKQMSSALVNRMVHAHLETSHRDWLRWAQGAGVHPLVLEYIQTRPDHLRVPPPKHEAPFSTPRSWHMLSDVLHSYRDNLTKDLLRRAAFGTVSPTHAQSFVGLYEQAQRRYDIEKIISGDVAWPRDPGDSDLLYFLVNAFRGQLLKNLPEGKQSGRKDAQQLAHNGKAALAALAEVDVELAQTVVADDEDGRALPDWFLMEVYRDLPRLAGSKS